MDNAMFPGQNVSMAQSIRKTLRAPAPRRHFIREWRKFRGLSQESLAERAGMTPNNLSQLENHKQRFSADGLERLAAALDCSPAELLSVDPSKDDGIWSIWNDAKPAERQQIVAVARALVGKRSP